mgnify:FL=1
MTVVLVIEGTIVTGGRDEIRIYVKKRYKEKLQPYIGREAKILLVIEDEGIQDTNH